MGTRAVVAVPHGTSWRGRYVHWDGSPDSLGLNLWRLIARDGLPRVAQVVTVEHHGWSTLDGQEAQELDDTRDPERFLPVPGYGVAYSPAEVGPEEWIGPDDLSAVWAEWVYVLTPDGVMTLAVDPDGRTSVHPWTP